MPSHGRIPEDRKTGWLALQPCHGLSTHESYSRISYGLNVKQDRHSMIAACVAEISAEAMGQGSCMGSLGLHCVFFSYVQQKETGKDFEDFVCSIIHTKAEVNYCRIVRIK